MAGRYAAVSKQAPRRSEKMNESRLPSESSKRSISQISQLAPDPASPIPAVHLKSRFSGINIFRKQIGRVDRAKAGDLVAVYGDRKKLLGYGLYNSRSELALRMLWREEALPTEDDWQQRLVNAVSLRQNVLRLDETADAWRVIHAESDGFPGLVVDRLGDVLSAECFSLGMYRRAVAILERLAPLLGTKHTIVSTSPKFESQEGARPPELRSEGCPHDVVIQEYGTRFRVRFEGGHKTGFFCDQRENRRKLAEFCAGKSVLDLCCYTGGFAVQAKKLGNAAEVTGVDLDESPLKLAKENANLNQQRIRFLQSDAFNYMRDMLANGTQFDVVVLDPPKLIRSRAEIELGTRKHFELNRLAMRLVKSGGILLSCTCAGLLPEPEFIRLLASAAQQSGPVIQPARDGRPARHGARTMQIIARTGAAPDHPVVSHCLETDYLNAAWMILR